jgi:iron(III) transport system substrate-binding protein
VVTTRIDAELGGGNVAADVIFSPDEIALLKWTAAGALAKLPDGELKKTTDYYAPMQVIGQGVVYNTTLVPAANLPKTWSDVLDPKWKGQILLGSPRMSTAYSQMYVALLGDPKYGPAFFEKLATQEPRIINTLAPMVQSIAAGEAALAFIGFPQDVVNLKQTAPTAPIDFAYLDVTTNAVTNVAIMAQAKHPNAAKLFAQWIMSTEGQTVHNGNGRASSQLGALPGTLPPPPVAALRPITSVDSAKQAPALIALFDSLFK